MEEREEKREGGREGGGEGGREVVNHSLSHPAQLGDHTHLNMFECGEEGDHEVVSRTSSALQ